MADHDLLSESVLRRALALEPDERVPRLDAQAIVVAAGRRTLPEQTLRVLRWLALAGVGIGLEAAVAVAAAGLVAELDLSGPFSLALSFGVEAAHQVVAIAAITLNPSVGVAALAAVIFATIYERTAGMESNRVRAS